MSLGMELERNIREAWLRLRDKILSNPQELQKRLARRRQKTLTQPPRAWCIAIRASDRRITPAHWVISPEHAMDLNHPAHPYEPIEHEVTIRTHAIRRYCTPVSFSREDAEDVAEMLGVSPAMLWQARKRGQFGETLLPHLGGKRGKPVPLLNPKGQLLDPGARGHARPHPIWGSMWEWLSREMPKDFEQTVFRQPVFRTMKSANASPTGEQFKDEMQHIGWRWLCPACKKKVSTIYYPVPVRTLFDTGEFDDPIGTGTPASGSGTSAGGSGTPARHPPTLFACHACHNIRFFSSMVPDAWNRTIAYLTAGLLYGTEVEKPASYIPERKKMRVRQLNREAPVRRKIFAALQLGLPDSQIASDLGITLTTVGTQILRICREERVPNRYELAKKLNFAPQPVNKFETAKRRRTQVAQLILDGLTWKEMMQKLGITELTLSRDIRAVYQNHKINPHSPNCKHELAQKLGRPFVSTWEALLSRIKQLRQTGLKWKAIATEIGVNPTTMNSYRQALAKREKRGHAPSARVAESPSQVQS